MCVLVMESMSLASERTLLLRRLAEVRDPRDPRGRCFSLVSLLLVTLCATAAGFGSYRAMAQWAAAAGPVELVRLGPRPCGPFQLVRTPSADTLRRALTLVRPADLEVLLRVRGLDLETVAVAVDGKVLRGSGSNASVAVTVIGAMAQDGALVAQQRVADKSDEIPALALLLSVLDLQGVVVTADALHTQVETAKVLVEEMGAHFVLVVKRNQPVLWEACRSIPWSEVTARHKRSEVGHGRLETRVVQAVTRPPPTAGQTERPRQRSCRATPHPCMQFSNRVAGCNVTVEPDLTLMVDSSSVDPDVTYEITYEIKGDESGPVIDTAELSDQTSLNYTPSLIQTVSSGTKVTIKIADVTKMG